MLQIVLFFVGLAVGSFLNVVALRYQPDGRLFSRSILRGRSHCVNCKNVLRWYELIPLLSFLIQGAKCRNCLKGLSWQYPIVELLTGVAFALLPFYFPTYELAAIWLLVILTLVLITLIDLRLSIIPDQLNIFLGLLGLAFIFASGSGFDLWKIHLLGLLGGAIALGLIIFVSRGRAMGVGDLKMAAALGLLFGWPKILLILGAAFILGGLFSVGALFAGKKSMKDAIPFGPFIAAGAVFVFFYGNYIINWYFGLL